MPKTTNISRRKCGRLSPDLVETSEAAIDTSNALLVSAHGVKAFVKNRDLKQNTVVHIVFFLYAGVRGNASAKSVKTQRKKRRLSRCS